MSCFCRRKFILRHVIHVNGGLASHTCSPETSGHSGFQWIQSHKRSWVVQARPWAARGIMAVQVARANRSLSFPYSDHPSLSSYSLVLTQRQARASSSRFPYHIKRSSRAQVRSCDVGEHNISSPLLGEAEDNRSEWGKVSLGCGTLSLISPNSSCPGVALTGEYWTFPVLNGMVGCAPPGLPPLSNPAAASADGGDSSEHLMAGRLDKWRSSDPVVSPKVIPTT